MLDWSLCQEMANICKYKFILFNYFFRMPYPQFLGYTKNEIKDLREVVEECGDVDFNGKSILD